MLVLVAMVFAVTACDLLSPPTPHPVEPPDEKPVIEPEEPMSDSLEGEYCSIERILPDEIVLSEEFEVTVVVQALQAVQSAYLEETGWFREFRRDRDTIVLWRDLKPGDKKVFLYRATMWSSKAKSHPWMTGKVSCNIGGLGQSEVLELRSELNLVLE